MSMGISGIGASGAPHVMSGASSYAPPATKMTNLFNAIDQSGSGSISQAQFNKAFNTLNPPGVFKSAGAGQVFSKLNPSGSGNVSKSDFVQGMTGLMRSLRGGSVSATSSASSATTPSPAGSLASSLQSLNDLGGDSASEASNGLGGSIDVLG